MPSPTYGLFAEAMAARKPVVCMYQGHPRAICAIILGHTDGAEKALTYQFEGRGAPAAGTASRKAASRTSTST